MTPAGMRRVFTLLPEIDAICRLGPAAEVPPWGGSGGFVSVTRTADELSIIRRACW